MISRRLFKLSICLLLLAGAPVQADWQQVIRDMPYQYSRGMADNLNTIRRWVLLSEGYCEQSERHIFFDQRGRFLAWMENLASPAETQQKLNERRQQLFDQGKVHRWLAGSESSPGYPFAVNCNQPHVDATLAMNRLYGRRTEDRLWGTWDGLQAGTESEPVSLAEVVTLVYQHRKTQLTEAAFAVPLPLLMGQLLVESGGNKQAHSNKNAIGILQLTPQVLDDCELDKRFHRHRMAQVDCAVRLYVINQRNLQTAFEARFGHLPPRKRDQLFSLLLLQSYHSGIGALQELLQGRELGNAAQYFAQHHQDYSAADIATGLVYHNIGRAAWGWASLFYVLDIQILAEQLCAQPESKRICAD